METKARDGYRDLEPEKDVFQQGDEWHNAILEQWESIKPEYIGHTVQRGCDGAFRRPLQKP